MILWLTIVQVAVATAAGLFCVILGLAGRRPSDFSVGALALLDAAAAGAVGLVLGTAVAVIVLVHRRLDAGAARADSTLRVAALQETTT